MDKIKKELEKRVIAEANYIISTKETIRSTANNFKVSKSTVHKDMNDRLFQIDKTKYNLIKEIMIYHISVRHIRGGESTKKKYKIGNSKSQSPLK